MNEDQIKGRAKEAMGKVQKNAGDLTDDESAQQKGAEKEIAGKVQKNWGDAKNKAADAIDE